MKKYGKYIIYRKNEFENKIIRKKEKISNLKV